MFKKDLWGTRFRNMEPNGLLCLVRRLEQQRRLAGPIKTRVAKPGRAHLFFVRASKEVIENEFEHQRELHRIAISARALVVPRAQESAAAQRLNDNGKNNTGRELNH